MVNGFLLNDKYLKVMVYSISKESDFSMSYYSMMGREDLESLHAVPVYSGLQLLALEALMRKV